MINIQNINGLKAIPPQGTIYLSVEVDCSTLKDITDDIELVKALRLEENVNVLPLSAMGSGICGIRLLTCCGD